MAQQPPALVTQPVDNSIRTVLTGNVHPLARGEFDQGEAPADLVLHRMLLVLKRSDQQETALRGLIENQQNKNSSSYHQWLTPAQFGAQFGPADSDIAAVSNWLTASGFQITQVSNGRTVIEFNGTAGQVKQAFGTAIHKYVVKGEPHWANAADPSIPTALTPVVAGFDSLHNFLKQAQNIHVGKYSQETKQVDAAGPNFTFAGCGASCYGLVPYDFATIYDVLPLWSAATPINGTGQTIAIVGRTDINPADATTFWSLSGLDGTHAPQPTLTITTNGPDPGFTGDEAEADIDTQWSGAVAPGATIAFVTSESTETDDGVDLSALYIVDNNVAPVMSESYGNCEDNLGTGGVAFYGAIWEQAAAQGITAMVSTGDNGSGGCDGPGYNNAAQFGLNVNGLASTPFNVAVGGTDFNQYNKWTTYWNSTNAAITQESAISYIPETTWNASCTNALFVTLGYGANAEAACNSENIGQWLDNIGGSGGASAAWNKPSWQTGTGVPSDNARDLPDVSLFASSGFLSSFYLICQMDTTGGVCDLNNFQGYGGTSVASPAFAGMMALVNQKWGAQGNANLVLYNLASKQPTAFHDIPVGSTIAMPCFTGSPNCTTNTGGDTYGVLSGYSTTANYDLATGLGSVDADKLVTEWNAVTFTPTTTTLTLNSGNPVNVTHGAAVPVTISVTSSSATGDVSLLVNPGKPGTPSIDWNSLSGGTVGWNTTLLPGGTYKVIAHYGGDKTYGGSYSSPSASITVNPESSFVYMPGVVIGTDANGNPIYTTSAVYGTGATDVYWLRADVQNSTQNFCAPQGFVNGNNLSIACPTGTIDFTDNGKPLDGGTFKMNSVGYAEDQGIQLTGGSHTLVATYSGDASYKTSNTSATITVTPATTSISSVAVSSNPVNAGQQFQVTATVSTSSFGVAPTGTLTFLANGTALLGTVQLTPTNGNLNTATLANLYGSLTTSISTTGTYNITATYSGDGNYTAVTAGQSNSVSLVVSGSSTTTNLGTSNQNPAYGASVTLTATVTTTGASTPTGSVTFNNGSTNIGSGKLSGSGVTATATYVTKSTDLAVGANQLTAAYGGDANNAASTSQPLTVTTGSPTFTLANTGATSVTVLAGIPGSGYAFTIAPVAPAPNFGAAVTLSCAIAPTDPTLTPSACVFTVNGTQTNTIPATNGSTAVTLNVNTAGPNTPEVIKNLRRRADNRSPWLPLAFPLAGIVMVGFAGRKISKYFVIGALCALLVLLGLLVACGGSSSTPPPVGINVTPAGSTVWPNGPAADNWPSQTASFTATVTNSSSNVGVNWALSSTVACTGNPSPCGSFTSTATATGSTLAYTAPTVAAGLPGSVTVTATSAADSTKTAKGVVTLSPATVPGTYIVTLQITDPAAQNQPANLQFTLVVQ